mgnify:CR=1 FL=1
MSRKITEIDITISQKLRELRQARSLTQQGLANMAGVSFQQIHKYEVGHSRIPVATLVKLTQSLGCSLESFLGEHANYPTTPLVDPATLHFKRELERLQPDDRQVIVRMGKALGANLDVF